MIKNLVILAITLVAIISVYTESQIKTIFEAMKDSPKKDLFKAFHFLHKKSYALNSEEGLNRYKIFKQNMKWIRAKNDELGREVYGITQFVDMTHEEFKSKYLISMESMKKQIDSLKQKAQFLGDKVSLFDSYVDEEDSDEAALSKKFSSTPSAARAPEVFSHPLSQTDSVNWTPVLNPARDQGQCGSCWAFAAVTTLEGNFNIQYKQLFDFSEQYLVNCDSYDSGCNGGWPSNTYDWLQQNGIVEEKELPYTATAGVCQVDALKSKEYKIVANYTMFDSSNGDATQKWYDLLKKGPMLVAMDASDQGFSYYSPKDQNDPWVPASCGGLNHAVTAVGYETINGVLYLRVRNSWGQDWGLKGYFLVRADKSCGILTYAWHPGVYNGTRPNPNPDPNPGPTPPTPGPTPPTPGPTPPAPADNKCVKVFPKCGNSNNFTYVCPGQSDINGNFAGIEFNYTTVISTFSGSNCTGNRFDYEHSNQCFVDSKNKKVIMKSLAFNDVDRIRECVTFFSNACFTGSRYEICGNINDLGLASSSITDVQSMLFDFNHHAIVFFDKPNFLGNAYSVSAQQRFYNVDKTDKNLRKFLRVAKSVMILKKDQPSN